MRFFDFIIVALVCEFANCQLEKCSVKIEDHLIVKRTPFRRRCFGIICQRPYSRRHPFYFHHLDYYSEVHPPYFHDFDYEYFPEEHLNPSKQVITCGTTTNISLPLTEKLGKCVHCTEITLKLKQLNDELLPESAFPNLEDVTHIHLDNLGIKYISPGAFEEQKELKEVYLSKNDISRITRGVFNNIEKLTVLDLSQNSIQDVDPNMLYKKKVFPLLLNLSHNAIDFVEEQLFQTVFFNLSSLDLSYNKIKDFDFKNVNGNVPTLDISHNGLLNFGGCIYNIPKLIISHNSIKVLENDCSDTPINMKYFDISHNKISHISYETFPENFGITTLLLQFNSISTISVGSFSNMADLRTLNLSSNSISSLPIGSFENLKSLNILDISNNLFKCLELNTLYNLPSLGELHIQNNMITDFKYEELPVRFPNIHLINLNNNNFTCDHLMETVFYLETKSVGVPSGNAKYEENVLGIPCVSAKKKLQEEEEEYKTKVNQSSSIALVEYVSSYYEQIDIFWIAMVILVLLLIILSFQTCIIYHRCHFRQQENVEML